MMKQKINTQLNIIEKSIQWVNDTDSMRGAKGENTKINLVNFRRKLNKKKFALEGNPAAAIYGASQMGKSYLVSNLLSVDGSTFTVIDGLNNSYVYLDKINPEGKKKEATSLVTRFSTSYQWKNPDFPVKAILLSLADLVLVLCDSFYNDVKAKIDIALKNEAIGEKVTELCNKYEHKSTQQSLLGEDDILEIRDYFHSNFSTKATNVIHSTFFEKIPSLIAKTQPAEWSEIFSLLWNNNTKFAKLFSDLINQYTKLDFANEIYLPIEAVLRDNGTLLDVLRLHEIYGESSDKEQNYKAETTVMILKTGQEKTIHNFSKSYLCALTAEVTFCLPKQLEKSKPFLKNTDLLDFPGARNRLGRHEEEIVDEDIPQMLLRGKVAYLFNKYSSSEKINILLFCQNSEKSEVQNIIPDLLNDWIGDMIGKTIEERNDFIKKSIVPPLFIISTMFNIDLQFDFNNDRPDNIDSRKNRWKGRFVRVFNEVFGSKKWLIEWTTNNPDFKNIYLLRDFRFSSETESKLFKGYNENKTETEEIFQQSYPNFRNDLRQSFIEYDFVKQHFENPAESWDRAVSINEDGTELIIEKLTIAANNINAARLEKSVRELNTISQGILEEQKKHFHDSDSDLMLQKAKSKAGKIQGKLDNAFGENPYFFGTLMKEMMLSQSDVYTLYLEKIRDIERHDGVNMDKYSAIRMRVPELDSNDNFENNLELLRAKYEMQTQKECQDFFENEEGIDLNELFYGNKERVKNFSLVLAEALETYWFDNYMPQNKKNLSKIFSDTGLQDIQEMLRLLYKKLQISRIIDEKIWSYVDGYRNIEDVYEMISDISTEIINKFINTIGLEYFSESDFSDLKHANEKNSLGLVLEHKELHYETNSTSEVAELISDMSNLSQLLNLNPTKAKRLPNYRNYIMWSDFLKVGFVSVCKFENYDIKANNKLKVIIEECKTIQY